MAIALEIYEALRSVGVEDAKAKSTAQTFDQALEGKLAREMDRLATREDLARLQGATREEMANVRGEMASMRGEIAAMREQMATREDLAKVRADLMKWMFLFWVGQQAVLLGILFAFFKP